ncbi:hypothetical protein L6452_02795 [Arctium lappa]|uniref:Uncharacterized protein n=1 Tax=Arctium lappa TaxID=4217 RepID=A0ACB9FK30_ARCLA|nr:hypothetical protein L6452_02795 [Arctium lappa]
MGLGVLLDMTLNGIPSKMGFYVVDALDTKEMHLRTHEGVIPISMESIHDLLGLPIGWINLLDFDEGGSDKRIWNEWKVKFAKRKMRQMDLLDVIQKSNDDEFTFKLNFLVLFVNIMAKRNTMGCCNFNFLSRIHDEEMIPKIDWCRYIYTRLRASKSQWNRDNNNCFYAGPLTYLTLLYVEETRCSSVIVPDKKPPLCAWTYDLMKMRESRDIANGGFGRQPLKKPANSTKEINEFVQPIDESNGCRSQSRETTMEVPT